MCATSAYGKDAYVKEHSNLINDNHVPPPSINPQHKKESEQTNSSEYGSEYDIIDKPNVTEDKIKKEVNPVSNKDIWADTVKNVYQDIKMTKERAKKLP